MNNDRRDFIIRDIGCIVCLLMGLAPMPAAKHHLLTTGMHGNGKRIGEKATVGICDYHHQGEKQVGTAFARRCVAMGYGPSYADNPRAFRARFPDALLLEEQERRITSWLANNGRGSNVEF